jgi:hypothetical protein
MRPKTETFPIDDQTDDDAPRPAGEAVVEFDGGSIWLGVVGYGDFHARGEDEGRIARIEMAGGRLRLVVWADREREAPTHIIDLSRTRLPRKR